MIGIYKITNKENGKVYIGQSIDIERRLDEHKKKRSLTIDDYINALGVENFTFEILEECQEKELDQKEQDYIKEYNSRINGYNIQDGGNSNSKGESNGRAVLKEEEIISIRKAYANHYPPKAFYEENFKNKISLSQFQAIWQGRSWSNIMPEVYTEENKKFYSSELVRTKALLSKAEVFRYRKYYQTHTRDEVYKLLTSEKGPIYKKRTFEKILTGDVRDNSIYKEVPIYKKSIGIWELNGKPVSTIPETWE